MSRSAFRSLAFVLTCSVFSLSPVAVHGQRATAKPESPAASRASSGTSQDTMSRSSIARGTGSIIGAVVDSLHDGGPLAHAGVVLMQLPGRHALTAESGAFRIDSIPPGEYTLELTHPVLDSLGIRDVSDTLTILAGQPTTVELAVPGAATITRAVCSPAKLRFGPGVILGKVVDAVTDKPAVGTEVSVAWTETEVGTDIGIRSAPRVRKATVAEDGTYRICGVPGTFNGSLQAIRGSAKTAEVPLEINQQALTTRMLYLPPAQTASTSSTSSMSNPNGAASAANLVPAISAVITGKVTNAGGVPVQDARVSVQGSASSTATGPDGKFTLTGVPPGTQSVLVRRVGYTPVELPLDVKARAPNSMTVRLGRYTPQLSSVEVKAKAIDPMGTTGFDHRMKTGMGKYMTEDQIDAIRPTYTTDVLRRIAGLYVTGSGQSAGVYTTRGNGCVRYLVDRNPMNATQGQTIDELVNPRDIAAIEFYQVADIPLELTSGSNDGCALLVVWTKGSIKDPAKK